MNSPPALTWVDWPAPRLPRRAALAVVVIAVTGAGAAWLDPFVGLICAALLLASTGEALLPSTLIVDEEGVEVSRFLHHRRVAWADLEGWRALPDGILLVGRGRLAMRARRRTVLLPFPADRAALEAHLRAHLGEPQRASATPVAA